MSPRIWLVRHSQTAWSGRRFCGRTDLVLTPSGEARAAALAASIGPEIATGAVLRASPLRRAARTAAAISAVTGLPLAFDVRWVEIDMGDAEGCTFSEVDARWPAIASTLAAGRLPERWPGGERLCDVDARVRPAWEETAASAAAAGCAVVVAHGMVLARALELAGVAGNTVQFAPAEAIVLDADGPTWRIVHRWRA